MKKIITFLFLSFILIFFVNEYSGTRDSGISVADEETRNEKITSDESSNNITKNSVDNEKNEEDIRNDSAREKLIDEDKIKKSNEKKADVNDLSWPKEAVTVQIMSSIDSAQQGAYFVKSEEKRPLIISLHQWSASFDHYDPLVTFAIDHKWNYIRPNFRGPNKTPKAGGSKFAVTDIDDAIDYALENGNVDPEHIHIVGASGGGHAALQHFMTSTKDVASYSAWVPITDLVAWYGESKVRENNYSKDILKITQSQNNKLNLEEARKRSPLHQTTPIKKAGNTIIQLYAGINDGYKGSVPISHTIRFYNKLVRDLNYDKNYLVSPEAFSELVYTQSVSEKFTPTFLFDERDIIYSKGINNLSLTIFDGDHEILPNEAFNSLLKNYDLTQDS